MAFLMLIDIMGLLGTLVKTGVDISNKLSSSSTDAVESQQNQLQSLLKEASDTAFGKFYGFRQLLKADDITKAFQSEVPIFNYEMLNDEWWQQQQKYPDITWPGKPDYFALSSGTTGSESKRIPITKDFIQSVRKVGASMVKSLPNYDLPKSLFESEILMLSSSADLVENDRGFFEGEISGINVSNFPGWYDTFYRPGKEIAAIDNWDKRIEQIAKEAPNWNIGAIAGIPSWVLLMLKRILEFNDLNNIHEIWPNLTVYASGGVAFETYRQDFEDICEKPLVIMDTYLASEGFFAYTSHPDTMAMELALDHGYFYEFVPFTADNIDENGMVKEDAEILTIGDVRQDEEYVLLISSCSGCWRYVIGDTIKFTGLDPHQILITGRTKFFLNTVGSQLSEEKMDAAVLSVSQELDITINEYAVSVLKDDDNLHYHQWALVSDDRMDEEKVMHLLDDYLKKANKNYSVARSKALKYIKVKSMSKAQYYEFLDDSKKKGGQVKTPKVMDADTMKQLLSIT